MNRSLMKQIGLAVGSVVVIVAAGVAGYAIAQHSTPAVSAASPSAPAQRKVLYWYDPMEPQQHFDHPGVSPMGMQLVPKYAGTNGSAVDNIVRINPAEVQNLGMRTAVVKVAPLSDTLTVPGTVAWDQDLAVTVSTRADATIEKLYVRAPFTAVKAGEPLAKILSPQWSAAAAEYFALRDAQSTTGKDLRAAALQRLHVLGMDAATIQSLHAGSGTITLRAPVAGVVSTLNVQQGQQVGAGAAILSINGLDQVWVNAEIPQTQVAGIAAGTPIIATVSALPGESFHGEVEQLLPDVSAATRTQRARIVLDNPQHDLAPGMFASVRITGAPGAAHPQVPTEASISDGAHTRVIEALGNGEFKPVRVTTGRSANGMTAVLSGLHGGERIVTSGQFLIDSEASLSGALQRMEAGHGHSGKARPASPVPSATSVQPAGMPGMNMPATAASSAARSSRSEPAPRASTKEKNKTMHIMNMPAASASSGSGDAP